MPLLKRKDKSPEPDIKSEKKSNKIKISAEKGMVNGLPAGGLSALVGLKRTDPANHAILPPTSRRYSVRIKMYALHKYLTLDQKTGEKKYTNKSIARRVNTRFGTTLEANTIVLWIMRGKWQDLLQGIKDRAMTKILGPQASRAEREALVAAKMDEENWFDPIGAVDTLYAPKHNKELVAATIFRRAAEQNKLAHKAMKFAAKQGMLVSSKECSERLAISAGEASSIFQATTKNLKEFIGMVEGTSPAIAINNNVTNNTANLHQQQVSLDLSTINYETIMLKFGDEQLKLKYPNKSENSAEKEEGELIVPIDNEFIRSTETDKT